MIYFTSDLHLGHKNIIEYEDRPWDTVEEMTIGLIKNWNEVVKPNDEVYILGDFAFQNSYMTPFLITDVLSRLNGKKHLIIGNHDTWISKQSFNPRYFEEMVYYKELKINGQFIILSHYPIEDWNGKYYGSIHLHGHTHKPDSRPEINRYSVGCMLYDYKPITLNYLLERGEG